MRSVSVAAAAAIRITTRRVHPRRAGLFLMTLALYACGSSGAPTGPGNGNGGGGGGTTPAKPFYPSQTFSDSFKAGTPDARWGCAQGGCLWQAVQAGPLGLDTAASTATPINNFVLESPDPQALILNQSGSCQQFSAGFTQPGTFAFDYFVKTATAIPLGQDGNYLEVAVTKDSVIYDPNFGDSVPVSSSRTEVLKVSGDTASRFQMKLPTGDYDFQFCYTRNRTYQIGPDFVQVDNVDTCAGTSCMGEIPVAPRCQEDQGATLVGTGYPDSTVLRQNIIFVTRVQGTSDKYYVIANPTVLDFISQGLQAAGAQFDTLRVPVDSMRSAVQLYGTDCEIDGRRALLIKVSTADIVDFVISTGIISEAFQEMHDAFWNYADQSAINSIIQNIEQKIEAKLLEEVAKMIQYIIAAII